MTELGRNTQYPLKYRMKLKAAEVAAPVLVIATLSSCQPLPPPMLEPQYKINIIKGDRDWSKAEVNDLAWALSKLTRVESAILAGYDFKRWASRESRTKADPAYTPSSETECAHHEVDFGTGKMQISIYDNCLSDECSYVDCPDSPVVGWLIPRYNILHEIGHAIASAEARAKYRTLKKIAGQYRQAIEETNKTIDNYNKAATEANKLILDFNAADPDEREMLEPKVEKAAVAVVRLETKSNKLARKVKVLERKLRQAKQEVRAADDGVPNGFEALIEGKGPLTGYSATSTAEAFAEAFAIFKVDPQHIRKVNKPLYEWFKSQHYLQPLSVGSSN